MGGFGSGRYEYASTPTVEQCRHLDVDEFTEAVDHLGTGMMVYWGGHEDPEASIRVATLSGEHLDALANGDPLQIRPVDRDADAGDEHADSTDGADGDETDVSQVPIDLPAAARARAGAGLDADRDDERAVALLLAYRVTDHRADETRDVRYIVPLEYTACNFGGSRPWFRCPGPAGRWCGKRVGKLYCPPRSDRYLCRHCYDLGYQSSRSSGDDVTRAIQRYRKAFAKADAEDRRPHPNNAPYFPERPTGMHHDTFEDLTDDVEAARREFHDAMERKMRELRQRYADLAGVDLAD